jgi:CBS domain-containing protein
MKVQDSMTRDVVSVDLSSTAVEAAQKMQSKNVGTVLVLDKDSLQGLVTDRQIVTKVIAEGKDPSSVRVTEFMSKNPATIAPDTDIHDAGKIMQEHGYRRIPVVESGKAVGIISIADLAEHAKTCKLCSQSIMKELQKAER